MQSLLQALQVPESSASAASSLQQLATHDGLVRSELERTLPTMLATPNDDPDTWERQVGLAGNLRIASTVPALAGYVRENFGLPRFTTEYRSMTQEGDAPAKALVEIGAPAIPAMEQVLKTGNREARFRAVLILKRIGSPEAADALKRALIAEKDEGLRELIQTPGTEFRK